MTNKTLHAIAQEKEITFDDIVKIIDQACIEKIRGAIESSDYSVDDVILKLTASNCEVNSYDIVPTIVAGRNSLKIICTAWFEENEVEGLSVAFYRRVGFYILDQQMGDVTFGEGAIAFEKTVGKYFVIESLYDFYNVFPEAFYIKRFCD